MVVIPDKSPKKAVKIIKYISGDFEFLFYLRNRRKTVLNNEYMAASEGPADLLNSAMYLC